ncbi:hypothetical protein [Noviherbaspirillum pedocola]|uniref:Uncharacterized protein n=1 Tax=Noviherbaspirillum pedocola TaxID=2801341 RepID=A0A934SVM8_9BURK|nr:hypothetical protein [Noviherbaspirillum pedocola]MBK4735981.1 hypothetical protein [Noviherbaspirillum pedocola]
MQDNTTHKMPKSKRGAVRQYNALVTRFYRELDGGCTFGIDWPTARSFFPKECAHIDAMRSAFAALPD